MLVEYSFLYLAQTGLIFEVVLLKGIVIFFPYISFPYVLKK